MDQGRQRAEFHGPPELGQRGDEHAFRPEGRDDVRPLLLRPPGKLRILHRPRDVFGRRDLDGGSANPLMYAQGGWEESRIHPTWVASAGSGFEMYYTGGYNEPQVGRATSVDGWNWTRDAANPVLALGAPGTWDQTGVAVAKVVTVGSATRLYYGGESSPENWRIGVADYSPGTSSPRYRVTGYFLSQVVDSGFRNTTWDSIDG